VSDETVLDWLRDKRAHKLLILFLTVTLIRGLIYVSFIPPWQAPDEEFHYIQSRVLLSIFDRSQLDDWKQDFIASLLEFNFDGYNPGILSQEQASVLAEERFDSSRKSLSYLLFALAALPLGGASIVSQLYAMRLVSVVITMIVVGIGWATFRELFPQDHFISIMGTSFLVFLPQHTHIGAAISDGNLAELLATASLYMLVRTITRGVNRIRVASFLILALLSLLTKTTTLPLILVIAVALVSVALQNRTLTWQAGVGVLGSVLFLGIAGLWLSPYRSVFTHGPLLLKSGFVGVFQPMGHKPGYPWTFRTTYQSFWAALGWLVVRVESKWYLLLLGMVLIAVLGLARFSLRRDKEDTPLTTQHAISILGLAFSAWVLMLFLWFMAHPTGEIYAQGRYLYPAIVPFAVLFALGWRAMIPVTWRPYVALSFFAFWFLFDAVTLWNYAIPFFYPLWQS
jgi:voltage-gated potassium channel Kch